MGTLNEIDVRLSELASSAGITSFTRVPTLGTNAAFIDALATVVAEALPDLSRPSMQQINEGNPVSLNMVKAPCCVLGGKTCAGRVADGLSHPTYVDRVHSLCQCLLGRGTLLPLSPTLLVVYTLFPHSYSLRVIIISPFHCPWTSSAHLPTAHVHSLSTYLWPCTIKYRLAAGALPPSINSTLTTPHLVAT